MLNVGKARQLIETYVGRQVNPDTVRELLNLQLRNFASRTGCLTSKATISSAADTQEYELPIDCIHVKEVHYDDNLVYKITFEQVAELAGNT